MVVLSSLLNRLFPVSRLIYQFYLFFPSVYVLHPLLVRTTAKLRTLTTSSIQLRTTFFPPHILLLLLRCSIVHFARFNIDLDIFYFTMDSLLYIFNSVIRWIRLKIYQYEVTFAVYMLTPTEKFIFSMSTLPFKSKICFP